MSKLARRTFLQRGLTAGTIAGLGDLGFLRGLPSLTASEVADPVVRLQPEIEPLVRLLEETPREAVVKRFAEQVRQGTSYREILAALQLAGVRNVQPRPVVGFKFHAVLVVNSAHLASLASPSRDRWLPIFWALDYFKGSQQRDIQEGDWTMAPVNESLLPSAGQAPKLFDKAMRGWDEEQADAAVAQMARHQGMNQLFESLAHYGIRDFRNIGHKAIFVANSWRTLNVIGWRHAEPILRSLTYALLNHTDEPNPANSDLGPDRPWRENQPLADTIRQDWLTGKMDPAATDEMIDVLRTGTYSDSSQTVAKLLNSGVSPASIYHAIFTCSGEFLMRQPGIVALHTMTTSNAMHYLFQTVASDRTRRLILLQNAAFLPMFRDSMSRRGQIADRYLNQLQVGDVSDSPSEAIESIFAAVGDAPQQAASEVLGYLQAGYPPEDLIDAARRLIFLKGHDSHDYKFSSAVLEDFYNLATPWRNQYLAASVYNLKGTSDRDNQLTDRTREALDA